MLQVDLWSLNNLLVRTATHDESTMFTVMYSLSSICLYSGFSKVVPD